MKINFGCGRKPFDGYCNIDAVHSPMAKRAPDILYAMEFDGPNLIHRIPLEDECAEEFIAIHCWEHFHRWQSEAVIAEWLRLLKPGGLLILELPDLIKCCKNIINGTKKPGKHPDQLGRWGLFGDPTTMDPYMMHPWGWSAAELIQFLGQNGFTGAKEKQTQFHRSGMLHRDMRIEARKA